MAPLKVILEDGTEKEVPTDEELKALQDKANEVDSLKKQYEDIVKEKAELEEGVNPNWPQVRKDIKRKENLEKALKDKGLIFGEDGKIIDDPAKKQVTTDDVDKRATEAATNVLLKNHIETKLLGLDKEVKDAVLLKYEKLSAGENLSSISDVEKYLKEAMQLVVPAERNVDPQRRGGIHGGVPVFKKTEITESTRQMGQALGISEKDYEKSADVSDLLLTK